MRMAPHCRQLQDKIERKLGVFEDLKRSKAVQEKTVNNYFSNLTNFIEAAAKRK